ncbi:MAG: nucleotidyltransferase family protein [Woeseiaceae bacterium]
MPQPSIFAIVLAAGSSRRFGATKQLQEYHGAPLVRRAVDLAEAVCGECSVLVTGHERLAVLDACKPLRGFFVHNSDYPSGMASSIAGGVRTVHHAADAILLLLADQPLVTTAHLESLVSDWTGSPDAAVATAFAGTVGPPVLLPARYFGELTALRGDRGARAILTDGGTTLKTVPFEPAAIDVDRPEDWIRLP